MASIYRFTLYGKARGQDVVNVTHWRPTAASPGSLQTFQAQAFGQALFTRWQTAFLTSLHSSYTIGRATLAEITGHTRQRIVSPPDTMPDPLLLGFQAEYNQSPVGQGGDIAGDSLPLANAAVIALATSLAGRRHKGRFKLGPIPEGSTTLDSLTVTGKGGIQGAANSWFVEQTSLTVDFPPMTPVIFSHTGLSFSPAPGDPRAFSEPITTKAVRDLIGSQRSRKPRSAG